MIMIYMDIWNKLVGDFERETIRWAMQQHPAHNQINISKKESKVVVYALVTKAGWRDNSKVQSILNSILVKLDYT